MRKFELNDRAVKTKTAMTVTKLVLKVEPGLDYAENAVIVGFMGK